MSIRLRLTLLYTGLMVVALALFSVLLYGVLRVSFTNSADQNLREVAGHAIMNYRVFKGLPAFNNLGDRSIFIAFRTEDGLLDERLTNLAPGSGLFPLPDEAVAGHEVFTSEKDSQGLRYRLYTLPVMDGGRPLFYVQVAMSLKTLDVASERLRVPLIFGILLFMGLGAWGTWWVAREAIAPIEQVAKAAEEIGSSADLGLRVPYEGPDDEVARLVNTFNDMLDQLQMVYQRLATAIDSQQRFVADASHELRTPLTIIRGNIGYLQKAGQLDLEALADMDSEAERMTRLVEELLSVARADAGQPPELQPVLLGPLVRDACRKAQALPHEAEFRTELPTALDRIEVLGHVEWLNRAFLILIENAFKYTPSGSVVLRAGRQGEGVVIQVQDTGIGISREDLPHIFDRFYRADRARSRGGAGLGLSIAYWVATVHGGKLNVESELGTGSTFSLWLPLHLHRST